MESTDSYLNIAAIGLWQRKAESENETKQQQKTVGRSSRREGLKTTTSVESKDPAVGVQNREEA